MTIYVFLGPSLPREQASRLLEATYLPPIQQGDLLRLLDRNPRSVGIIDGFFETVPAVWHKEILLVMSRGVHVFGAASMGALRAAELHSFGMVGVGTIFEWYRDGQIVADDEVAVHHGPVELGYLPLSRALVDIRDCCAGAMREGVIPAELGGAIVDSARTLRYWERSYDVLAAELRRSTPGQARAIDDWLAYAERCTSLKARDASALLQRMAQHATQPWRPKRVDFVLEQTVFIERLVNEIDLEKAVAGNGSSVTALCPEGDEQSVDDLRTALLLRLVARSAAQHFGWELDSEEISEEAGSFCVKLGLASPEAMRAWMAEAAITEPVFWSYVCDELFIKRLIRTYALGLDRELPDHVRIARACRRFPVQATAAPSGSASDPGSV